MYLIVHLNIQLKSIFSSSSILCLFLHRIFNQFKRDSKLYYHQNNPFTYQSLSTKEFLNRTKVFLMNISHFYYSQWISHQFSRLFHRLNIFINWRIHSEYQKRISFSTIRSIKWRTKETENIYFFPFSHSLQSFIRLTTSIISQQPKLLNTIISRVTNINISNTIETKLNGDKTIDSILNPMNLNIPQYIDNHLDHHQWYDAYTNPQQRDIHYHREQHHLDIPSLWFENFPNPPLSLHWLLLMQNVARDYCQDLQHTEWSWCQQRFLQVYSTYSMLIQENHCLR